jgi:hypothetical protein
MDGSKTVARNFRVLVEVSHESAARGCQMVNFQIKIPNWVKFGGQRSRKCYNILWPFGIYYGHLVYFMAIF